MSKMYYRPNGRTSTQKVLLATPSYDGVGAGYAFALFHSASALADAGIDVELAMFDGGCHVDDARNMLVRDFLLSDCTDLVFLDADISWQPQDLVKLCQYDRDVVAGAYPKKQHVPDYPVSFLPGEIWADEGGLIEVAGVATGFLRIRRKVLEQLAEQSKRYDVDNGEQAWLIFERQLIGNTRWGGDYAFCLKWRTLGGRVYLSPEFVMDHGSLFSGSIGHHLRAKEMGEIKSCLFEIRHKLDTPETYESLSKAWGNEGFAALPDLIAVAVQMARKSLRVLECGSGATTLAMAATGASVYSLEHNEKWAEKVSEAGSGANIYISVDPLSDEWYQIPGEWRDIDFDFVLVDGPPRAESNRAKVLDAGIRSDVYLIDDVDDPASVEITKQFGEVSTMGKHRLFAIARKRWQQQKAS